LLFSVRVSAGKLADYQERGPNSGNGIAIDQSFLPGDLKRAL